MAKKCVNRTILTDKYKNISGGGNFNQLVSLGVVYPTGILIVPHESGLMYLLRRLHLVISLGNPLLIPHLLTVIQLRLQISRYQ